MASANDPQPLSSEPLVKQELEDSDEPPATQLTPTKRSHSQTLEPEAESAPAKAPSPKSAKRPRMRVTPKKP